MTTHSSILAWKFPRTEEPGKLTVHGVTKGQTQLSIHRHWHSNGRVSQWNTTQSLEIDPHISSKLIFDKASVIQWERRKSFQQMVLEKLDIQVLKRKKRGPYLILYTHIIYHESQTKWNLSHQTSKISAHSVILFMWNCRTSKINLQW